VKPARHPLRPSRDADAELSVVLVPPATPEEVDDAWRRLVEALDWLATLGAMDS
jgi:hypothetical protein